MKRPVILAVLFLFVVAVPLSHMAMGRYLKGYDVPTDVRLQRRVCHVGLVPGFPAPDQNNTDPDDEPSTTSNSFKIPGVDPVTVDENGMVLGTILILSATARTAHLQKHHDCTNWTVVLDDPTACLCQAP